MSQEAPEKRSRRIGTGVVLTLFFLTLLAVNVAFFVIAFSQPSDEIPPEGFTPPPPPAKVAPPLPDGAPRADG